MTYHLGAELSGRIAAIGVVVGSIGAEESNGSILKIPNPSVPVHLIAFHGKEDRVIPYNGGVGVDGVDFLSVADSINFWVNPDGCNNIPQKKVTHNGNILTTDYIGGMDGSEVVPVTIGNGKHDWPSTALANQISAKDAIWDFFMRHPKTLLNKA